ncbi:AMP-binding protein [Achromobacter anxifer]|uniref:AMP-binding protein n=1 Tax=Achromobacter anxifer TaxID=1287737 RepID=UPI0023F9B14A|nr:AMP-binding protein [Achromobacter anxifer]MDF8362274.1 AMP-binding protein [Achromobacter anxifer]
MFNLSAAIAYHARRAPDSAAIIFRDEAIGYADFHERIRQAAALLQSHGIGRNDVVALFMKNSAAFLELAFAASYLGAVFLPINYRLAAPEAGYILADARAKLLFVDEEFKEVAALEMPKIVLDAAAQADSRRLGKPGLAVPEQAAAAEDDLVRLMYTSGTTSRPKGVMHTYGNIHWKSIDHVIALGLTHRERLLVVGPLYHVGAFDLPGIAVLWVGGTLCVHREFDPEAVLASIERHRLTCGWMAPVMLSRVLAVQNPERYALDTFGWCIAGGEKTPESRIRDFTRVFTRGRFIDGFGMTETCSGDTLMEPGREIEKIGSTGRALPHVEIRIADNEGRWLPAGEKGEICVRGPKVTKGYWNAPEKTAEAYFGDWLRSGDVGYLDDEDFLFVTDRTKDMILTGAENVASSEVEAVLYEMPQIAEAAVIGVHDEQWGERITAVVVLNPGQTLTLEELDRHCRKRVANFKVPRELKVVDELPRNPSGKVLKRVLRDRYNA